MRCTKRAARPGSAGRAAPTPSSLQFAAYEELLDATWIGLDAGVAIAVAGIKEVTVGSTVETVDSITSKHSIIAKATSENVCA